MTCRLPAPPSPEADARDYAEAVRDLAAILDPTPRTQEAHTMAAPTRVELLKAIGDVLEVFDDLGSDRLRFPALRDVVYAAGDLLERVDEEGKLVAAAK